MSGQRKGKGVWRHAWTGEEAVELSHLMRKKILDFYHRNSMTSYCLGFSYRCRPYHIGVRAVAQKAIA